jgi:hypothetical protein
MSVTAMPSSRPCTARRLTSRQSGLADPVGRSVAQLYPRFGKSSQRSELPHPLHSRPGWITTPGRSRGNVGHNPRSPCHPCTLAYRDVRSNRNSATKDDKIFNRNAATKTGLCDDDTIAANDYVVTDLTEIVDLCSFSDDRVSYAAPVNRRAGPDLYVVMDNDSPGLRHFLPSGTGDIAKTVLPNMATRMDYDALAHKRMCNRTARANRAVAAYQNIRADHGRGGDDASRSNLSSGVRSRLPDQP